MHKAMGTALTRSTEFWQIRQKLVMQATELQASLSARKPQVVLPRECGANVLVLFNGIGCFVEALRRLNFPIGKLYVNDWDDDAQAVMVDRFPEADVSSVPRDAENITEDDVRALGVLHVFFASPPCTDLAPVKLNKRTGEDHRAGFDGATGRLFRKTIEVWGWVRKHNPNCKFVVENCVFDDMPDWHEAAAGLGGEPTVMNAINYSYTWRKRAYWHNLQLPDGWDAPLVPPGHPNSVLVEGGTMINRSAPTITASWLRKGTDAQPEEWTRCPLKVRTPGGAERFLKAEEAEALMGLPRGYTAVQGMTPRKRLHMLGNGIDVTTLVHLLRNLRLTDVHPEEVKVRERMDGEWANPIMEEVDKPLTLNAAAMAEWLTPGPCPGDKFTEDWVADCCHPTVAENVPEWAHGADLRYEGDRLTDVAAPNCASCYTAPGEMRNTVWDGVAKGHVLGPYPLPPLAGFKQTPRALIDEMEKSNKFRPISANNLPVGEAVNEAIPNAPDPICLTTHDRFQQLLRMKKSLLRPGGKLLLAKRDLRSAYRVHAVRPADWQLCGFQWDGQYFVDARLSFGCRSSVDRFLTVSDAIEYVMRRWGVLCVHYIDDFCFVEEEADMASAIQKFEIVCAAFGIEIKVQKNEGPAARVEVLGVVYDAEAMTAAMPAKTLTELRAGCATVVAKRHIPTKAAASLVGVMSWAAACIPHARTFVSALRHAENVARKAGNANIKATNRVVADARWWVEAIDGGMAAHGVTVIPAVKRVACLFKGDAGSLWGMGAHSDDVFYKAKTPPHVTKAAMRTRATSSKYLELFQMLVLARLQSTTWAGCHVEVRVDNRALVPAMRKMRSSRQADNDILRELALLQAVHGWSWTVRWIPRELNDAADALSKDDMQRFRKSFPKGMSELKVQAKHLEPPRLKVFAGGARRAAPHPARRPARMVLGQPITSAGSGSALEQQLWLQLATLKRQIRAPADSTGVRSYLRFCDRMGWSNARITPEWEVMVENLQLYVVDAVQTYTWSVGGVLLVKRAVSTDTVRTYLSHINKWYATTLSVVLGVTQDHRVKEVVALLAAAYPRISKQKLGFTVTNIRRMVEAVHSVMAHSTDALMWEAMFLLAWFGLLRPGEFTVPSATGFDVTKHPCVANVIFYCGDDQIWPGDTRTPTHMVFVVKQSKTDQERLTKDIVVGPTQDRLCALTAMWAYLGSRSARGSGSDPLFVEHGHAVTYSRMRAVLSMCMRAAAMYEQDYGGHSFRIGGAQSLAASGKSVLYCMSYGRWRCTESVLRYVTAPDFVRALDASHMVSAVVDVPWAHITDSIRQHYDRQQYQEKLWTAKGMLSVSRARVVG